MPEIFTLLNNSYSFTTNFVKEQFESGIQNPKQNYTLENVMIKALYGGRTINNTSTVININDIAVVCDGKIYNHTQLFETLGIEPETDYDYEIIVHLYQRYGIEATLQMLDGSFAFVLSDHRYDGSLDARIYVVRDPFGTKPLFMLRPNTNNILVQYKKTDGDIYALSSNTEMVTVMANELNTTEHPDNSQLLIKGKSKKPFYVIESVLPGTYSIFELKFRTLSSWRLVKHQIPYHSYDVGHLVPSADNLTNKLISQSICKRIEKYENVSIVLTGNYEGYTTAAITLQCCNSESHNSTSVKTFSLDSAIDQDTIKLVTQHLDLSHNTIAVSNSDMISEKENIPYCLNNGAMENDEFCQWWFIARHIAHTSPKSIVLLEIGIDELDRERVAINKLDFRFKMQKHFKTIYDKKVGTIAKIFWTYGLDVEFPWLDRILVQYLVANNNNDPMIFNPKGIYGNLLLPEEMF